MERRRSEGVATLRILRQPDAVEAGAALAAEGAAVVGEAAATHAHPRAAEVRAAARRQRAHADVGKLEVGECDAARAEGGAAVRAHLERQPEAARAALSLVERRRGAAPSVVGEFRGDDAREVVHEPAVAAPEAAAELGRRERAAAGDVERDHRPAGERTAVGVDLADG